MLQIGIRAHDMEAASIGELVENISRKGFTCTQLALSKAITEFSTDIEAMTPGFAMYLKKIFLKNNIDVSVLGCYLDLANNNKEEFAKTAEIYKAHIRFASLLGCGMVGTETWGGNLNPKSDEALEVLIENIKQIVSYAEKMGVIIGMEPVQSHVVFDMKRAREVLDAVDSPNLQIIFDPVNVITKENYENQDKMIIEAFELLGKDIICIHAKDFVIDSNGNVQSVISGDGLLNYQLLLRLVRKHKPFIHILLEETKPENVFNAKGYIEKIYDKV